MTNCKYGSRTQVLLRSGLRQSTSDGVITGLETYCVLANCSYTGPSYYGKQMPDIALENADVNVFTRHVVHLPFFKYI